MHTLYTIIACLFLCTPPNTWYEKDTLPEVNEKVLRYVDSVIGTTVGRGECWDLADQALTFAGARFDKTSRSTLYIFGEKYDPAKKAILPGDIIQFKDVTVSFQDGRMIFTQNFKHHTAIVYQVYDSHSMQLAHQNTSFAGKKVALSDLDLDNVQKGRLIFYRPLPE